MPTGSELIHQERIRQLLDEGFGAAHDDEYARGELVAAADHYAIYARRQISGHEHPDLGMPGNDPQFPGSYYGWPWSPEWWRPSDDPVRNLVKAGALIAAEIDRLQRAASKEVVSSG